jgi:hypothetical protein
MEMGKLQCKWREKGRRERELEERGARRIVSGRGL